MPSFDEVWARIVGHAGQPFQTITGLEFTYEVEGNALRTNRTDYLLTLGNVETAFNRVPIGGPGEINQLVRGPAYVWAILHDQRIRGNDW